MTSDTFILLASQNGHLEVIKYLINKKSNLIAKNVEGYTAFIYGKELTE